MTHAEALNILIAWIVAGEAREPTSADERAAAEDHVSHCPGCWDELRSVHEMLASTQPDGASEMAGLFDCEPVREDLYLLVGLTPAEIAARHPRMARHLSWCHGCREDLTDLLDLASFDTMSAEEVAPSSSVVVPAGFAERLRISVRGGGVRFVHLPAHLTASPLAHPAGAWRGEAMAPTRLARGERLHLPLGSDLDVYVVIEPQESDLLRLTISTSAGAPDRLEIVLRELGASGEPILAALTTTAHRPLVVVGLRLGSYVVEVFAPGRTIPHRIALSVE